MKIRTKENQILLEVYAIETPGNRLFHYINGITGNISFYSDKSLAEAHAEFIKGRVIKGYATFYATEQ